MRAESALDGEFREERTGREAARGGIGHAVHNGGIDLLRVRWAWLRHGPDWIRSATGRATSGAIYAK